MQTFTYTKTGHALRSKLLMLQVVIGAEMVFWFGISFLFQQPWRGIILGLFGAISLAALGFLGANLRRRHRLDAQRLTLAFSRYVLAVDRGDITAVGRLTEPLPRGIDDAAISYQPEDDTLYILAARKGLVTLALRRPYEAKVPRKGICQFTQVVLSLDEPDAFLAALGGAPAAQPAETPTAGAVLNPVAIAGGEGPELLRLRGLVRRYGDFTAVRGLDLAVRPGEVLAFLGGNGAGKTTTIKMITGLLKPTEGQVLIGGRDLWAEADAGEVRRLVGYVPDVPLLYESLTAKEFLWLMAGLYGLPEAAGQQRADELLAMLQLSRWGDQLIRSFSLGMKRKMAIAAALIHRPKLFLLDEVTNGLDPRAAREVKDFIARAAAEGAAVLLTTHILEVAAELSHRIAIIDGGQLRALGSLADLRTQVGLPEGSLEEIFLAVTGDLQQGVSA